MAGYASLMKTLSAQPTDNVIDVNLIDKLPLTRLHWFWLGLAALAWLMESYDIGLIGVVLGPLQHLWHLGGSEVGIIVASGTIGVALGVLPAGRLADKVGRKRVMVLALIEYSMATVLTAWSPDWQWFVALRLVAGIGLGAMFPLPYTMIAELSPIGSRGRMAGMLDASLSFGYFMAPLAAFTATRLASGPMALHILFFIGGVGFFIAVLVAKYLPESPRWLAFNGRTAEAELILHRMATSSRGRTPGGQSRVPRPAAAPVSREPKGILSSTYRRRTVMLWISFPAILFMFYAIMTFMPMILAREGLSVAEVDMVAAIIMGSSIPGKWAESWLVERVGRKPVIVGFSLIAAFAALVFPLMHGILGWLLVGLAFSFFGIAVDPAMKIYAAEQYPTEMRGTGVGFAEAWARLLGGALAPYIMAIWLSRGGISISFDFIAGVAVVGAIAVAWLGSETRDRSLEYRFRQDFVVGSAVSAKH